MIYIFKKRLKVVRPGDEEICWKLLPLSPSRLFPLMTRMLPNPGSLELFIMSDDAWCLASLLSSPNMLASLISKLMDKSSWPIHSLLMYWDHWIWMNTFWRIFFFLDSGKLLQLFFWSFDLRNVFVAPEGIVIAQWCVTALNVPTLLDCLLCQG